MYIYTSARTRACACALVSADTATRVIIMVDVNTEHPSMLAAACRRCSIHAYIHELFKSH